MFQVKNLILMKGRPPAIFSCSWATSSALASSVAGFSFSLPLGDALEAADDVDVGGRGSDGPRANG